MLFFRLAVFSACSRPPPGKRTASCSRSRLKEEVVGRRQYVHGAMAVCFEEPGIEHPALRTTATTAARMARSVLPTLSRLTTGETRDRHKHISTGSRYVLMTTFAVHLDSELRVLSYHCVVVMHVELQGPT